MLTMPRSDRLTASYRSGVRFVGLILPAPPWMISRGLIWGEDCGRLYSIFSDDPGRLKQRPEMARLGSKAALKRRLEHCWRTVGGRLEGHPGAEEETKGHLGTGSLIAYLTAIARQSKASVPGADLLIRGKCPASVPILRRVLTPSLRQNRDTGSKLRQDKCLKRTTQDL